MSNKQLHICLYKQYLKQHFSSQHPVSSCRKEPFANGVWQTKAENWNGRVAMMGFTALIITEALSGKSIPQFYGFM